MIRSEIARQLDHDPHFRWRGEAVTRIENLSDIVFALALGMLVSASNPPETYAQLMPHLLNIVPVAAGFAIMLRIWNDHFVFFRRYGVADGHIIVWNAVLLLLVLFIAYPLRFAFDGLFAFILTLFGNYERMQQLGITSYRQAGVIIAWFNVGIACIHFVLARMYSHALNKADVLSLNDAEKAITRRSIWRNNFELIIAAIVAPLAAFTMVGPFAAFLSVLNWPIAVLVRRRIKIETPPPEASIDAADTVANEHKA